MVEEALRSGVPVLMIDVKGDLPNLLLRFPSLSVDALLPWVDNAPPSDTRTPLERAQALAESHRQGLLGWDLTEEGRHGTCGTRVSERSARSTRCSVASCSCFHR
jgi:hypothetical protein